MERGRTLRCMAFIGREPELALIAEALAAAAEGSPACVAIPAPSGSGATTLLDELERRLAGASGTRLLRGAAHEPWESVPLGPLAADLDLPGAFDRPAADRRSKAASRRSSRSPRPVGPPRSVEEAVERLDELGRETLLVLVLEDLQWADSATLALVAGLAALPGPARRALVVSWDPERLTGGDSAASGLAALARTAGVRRVSLAPLSRGETTALIRSEAPADPGETLGAALAAQAGDRPLVARWLARSAGEPVATSGPLADPLEAIIAERLAVSGEEATRVIGLLAAARRPLPVGWLISPRPSEVSPGPPKAARSSPEPIGERAVDAALRSGLTVLVGTDAKEQIGIDHPLVGEIVTRMAPHGEARQRHQELAERFRASAEGGREPIERVRMLAEAAWHWTRAGRVKEAAAAHLDAADALAGESSGAAWFHLRAAIAVDDHQPSEALLERAADAALRAGRPDGATQMLGRGRADEHRRIQPPYRGGGGSRPPREAPRAARPPASGSPGTLTGALLRGRAFRRSGEPEAAIRELERALEPSAGRPDVRSEALALLGRTLGELGRPRALDVAREAARTATAADEERRDASGAARIAAYLTLATLDSERGDHAGALRILDEQLDEAARSRDARVRLRVATIRAALLERAADRTDALDAISEARADASVAGLVPAAQAALGGIEGHALWALGRAAEAERSVRASVAWRRMAPDAVGDDLDPALDPEPVLALLLAETRLGDAAEDGLGRVLAAGGLGGSSRRCALVGRIGTSVALWRGRPEDALGFAGRAWDQVSSAGTPLDLPFAGATALEACAAATAAGRLRGDWPLVAEAGALGGRVVAVLDDQRASAVRLPLHTPARREASLWTRTAHAHHARMRGEGRASTWGRLAEAWRAAGNPYQAARARLSEATVTLERGESRAAARGPIGDAWRIGEEIGAQPLLAALRDLAGRAGIPLPQARGDTSPPAARRRPLVAMGPGRPGELEGKATRFGLSPREWDVLRILVEGRTNREIGRRLFISDRTVGVHVRRILAKLGATGRVEATGKALRLGLLEPPEPLSGGEERVGLRE